MYSKQQKDNKQEQFLMDDFPVPPPRTKPKQSDKPHYSQPHKVGKPHQEFINQSLHISMNSTHSNRKIPPEELKKHNKKQSAWISINGSVYDVTKYMDYHPGGLKLLQGCGTDGTSLFNKYHPWVNYALLLEKYKIGYLDGRIGPSANFLNV